jgi:hypothetical protein
MHGIPAEGDVLQSTHDDGWGWTNLDFLVDFGWDGG